MKNFHPRMLMMVSVLAFTILTSVPAMAAPPIKVGLLVPLSGPYAIQGIFMKNGTALAFEQAGEIAGRKVEIIVEDTEMKPDVGITKWRKLVEKDKVHFTAGTYSSPVGLAIRDMAHKYQVPHIYIAGISAQEFLTTKLSPWVRHANYGGVIHEYAVVSYMTKEKKLKKIVSMVPDYAWGWSMEDCIKGVAKNNGAQVIQAMRTAFPTMDFSPYIAKFNKDADAIYVCYTGADAQRFVKQAKQLGVNISNVWSSSVFMPGLVEDVGLDAIGGHGGNVWLPGVDNPESKAFTKAYKEKFKEDPGMQAAVSYTSMLATIKILKSISGNIEDKRAFLDGWYNLGTIKTPIGNFGYEKSTESGIQSMYMYEVIEKDKKPHHKIVAEYPNMKSSDMLKAMGLMK